VFDLLNEERVLLVVFVVRDKWMYDEVTVVPIVRVAVVEMKKERWLVHQNDYRYAFDSLYCCEMMPVVAVVVLDSMVE
jgi:hypothetical protein